jgi:hypothetical protein
MTEKIEISDVAEADLPACGLVFLGKGLTHADL